MTDELTLDQLRALRGFTQAELSELLGMSQAAVSKLEFRNDSYVSSLRRFVEALGGKLELRAVFPNDTQVRIRGLDGDDVLTQLRRLVHHPCRISPLVPDHQWNRFLLRSIDAEEREVELEKTSNANLIYIPIRRIVEVLPASESGKSATLVLNGRVEWLEDIQRWRFAE